MNLKSLFPVLRKMTERAWRFANMSNHQSSITNPQSPIPNEAMLLTDELLLYYKRCRRRAFLDYYGDPSQKDPPQDFLLKLRQDSSAHRQVILKSVEYEGSYGSAGESPLLSLLPTGANLTPIQTPKYGRDDWQGGAQATWELMQQGVDCIAKGVLLRQTVEGVTLLGSPDLLLKQPGQSIFGDWMYVPVSIKFGRRAKADYQIIAAFHAHLLAEIQGSLPSQAWLILRRQNAYSVTLDKWLPLMQADLADCIQTLGQAQAPEVFISRQKCGLCHWHSSCYAIAQSQKHISLIPGVTPKRYQSLQELGITTVESLAQAEISTLAYEFGSEVALNLVQQAQSIQYNRVILRQRFEPARETPPFDRLTESENNANGAGVNSYSEFQPSMGYTDRLPQASVELFFDIEAQPDLNLDYLLGILVIDRSTNTETFHPFLAEHPDDEALIWQQFLDLVWLYPDAPIFHFSDYEVETVKRLAKLYKTPFTHLQPLLSRFVDVHQQVISTVTLPVESYSLKHLARWLGFEWRDAAVTGSQCVCLYEQWLTTGDRTVLEMIQRYNEDDCRATYHLKDWLCRFLQANASTSA